MEGQITQYAITAAILLIRQDQQVQYMVTQGAGAVILHARNAARAVFFDGPTKSWDDASTWEFALDPSSRDAAELLRSDEAKRIIAQNAKAGDSPAYLIEGERVVIIVGPDDASGKERN